MCVSKLVTGGLGFIVMSVWDALAIRYKAKEIERMRERLPLGTLVGLAKQAPPPRDFRGAILNKLATTGEHGRLGFHLGSRLVLEIKVHVELASTHTTWCAEAGQQLGWGLAMPTGDTRQCIRMASHNVYPTSACRKGSLLGLLFMVWVDASSTCAVMFFCCTRTSAPSAEFFVHVCNADSVSKIIKPDPPFIYLHVGWHLAT